MKRIYMDAAATTKMSKEVVEAMEECYNVNFGNPSSIYEEGVLAGKKVLEARKSIAKYFGVDKDEIYFTSGGSEADNWALEIGLLGNHGGHIIVSQIEHKAVLAKCVQLEKRGFKVSYIPVDKDGVIDLKELRKAILPETCMISVMMANNEIGTIQPIYEIGKIAKENHILFHTDAVCALTKMPIDIRRCNINMLSATAHKIGGPKGVGLLYVGKNVKMNALIYGGPQEFGLRAGTENVAGIVGFAKALEIKAKEYQKNVAKMYSLQRYFIKKIFENIPNVRLNGSISNRLPMNVNVGFRNVDGTNLTLLLDADGISCSAGSACSQGEGKPSHVILALGVEENVALGSVRFTFDENIEYKDIDYVVECLKKDVELLRKDI